MALCCYLIRVCVKPDITEVFEINSIFLQKRFDTHY